MDEEGYKTIRTIQQSMRPFGEPPSHPVHTIPTKVSIYYCTKYVD